jgi:hypothetical protein
VNNLDKPDTSQLYRIEEMLARLAQEASKAPKYMKMEDKKNQCIYIEEIFVKYFRLSQNSKVLQCAKKKTKKTKTKKQKKKQKKKNKKQKKKKKK